MTRSLDHVRRGGGRSAARNACPQQRIDQPDGPQAGLDPLMVLLADLPLAARDQLDDRHVNATDWFSIRNHLGSPRVTGS